MKKMTQLTIKECEAGQRIDKFLIKYLNDAPQSFIYKMMRKKNIVLNKKKCSGNEKLLAGDEVTLFLSQETIDKFRKTKTFDSILTDAPLDIIYENKHVCLINKPVGMLSQKARENDVSLTEYLTAYLLSIGELDKAQLETFHPAVCNRLDRNTSGLMIGGKTLLGIQTMSSILKQRTARKYYLCVVEGRMEKDCLLKGYLTKQTTHNRAVISNTPQEGASYIETNYRILDFANNKTLVEAQLLTGRTHQIRAQLSSIGHPIIGDGKYGNPAANKDWRRRYQLKSQFLHSYRLAFPKLGQEFADLSEKEFVAPLPRQFMAILEKEGFSSWLHGIQED